MRPIPSLSRKLVSASGVALAVALLSHAPVAQAQSFQGTVSATFGSVTVDNSTPLLTNVSVSSDSAVINWIPSDANIGGGPITFQNAGTTATFTGSSGTGSNFAVLNRIIPVDPNRPILFNGAVNSEIVISGPGVPGGNVFFYSPGGIILGSTAAFNVGSLALTTLDLNYNTTSGAFDTAGAYAFQQATVADSKVRVLSGAQINTTVPAAYVALVAPSVTNDGAITLGSSGSVALVAADAATITFSPSGLFDIQVTSGTSSTATVLANGGSITGPAAGTNDNNRVYLVAVPKNDAITMAIGNGSTLGFDIAGAANVSGNAVILSGGFDINGGNVGVTPSAGGGTGQVSVTGGDADITSAFSANATGGISLGSNLAGGLNFASDVSLASIGGESMLFANGAGIVNVTGDLSITGNTILGVSPATGMNVSVLADSGGTVNLNGNVLLNSNGLGGNAFVNGSIAGAGFGGTARIDASNGGQISIQGDLTASASGIGGAVSAATGGGGDGIGGNIFIRSSFGSGSSINIVGDVNLTARGDGGNGLFCTTCTPTGGTASGGIVTLSASTGNQLSIGGSATIDVTGNGGDADGTGVLAGQGTGGQARILSVAGGDITTHTVNVLASGLGGDALGGGAAAIGQGGYIEVSGTGTGSGLATFNGAVSLTADGIGGNALFGGVAAGATGGIVLVSGRDGSTLDFTADLTASASASGGSGLSGAPVVTGGTATLEALTGGTVTVAALTTVFADAISGVLGALDSPTTSSGGLAQISAGTGSTVELQSNVLVRANALGTEIEGSGPAGAAIGGTARIIGNVGSLFSAFGNVSIVANGNGGGRFDTPNLNIQGGNGTGGTASFDFNGGLATVSSDLTINAFGTGGQGGRFDSTGVAGNGTGGLARLTVGLGSPAGIGGSVTVVGQTNVDSSGFADEAFIGGQGNGGQSFINARAGNINLGVTTVNSQGVGGIGTFGGSGGVGTGGLAQVFAFSSLDGPSQIQITQLSANASAFGGIVNAPDSAGIPGGNGGNATAGSILVAGSAGNGVVQVGATTLLSNAFGGDGGAADEATGGNGGNATGGNIQVGVVSGTDTGSINLGSATYGSISAMASATGGAGGTVANPIAGALGGNGGNANGGGALLLVRGAPVTITGLATFQSNATGGGGGFGDTNGVGGNAFIGVATTDPNVISGSVVRITNRFNQIAQRGSLIAQDLVFAAQGTGGTGSVNGTSSSLGRGAGVFVDNGSLDAANISLFSLADDLVPTVAVNPVILRNSAVTVAGLFQLNTSANTSLSLDQSSLNASSVAIGAANWVYDSVVPGTLGTVTASGTITLTTGLDLLVQTDIVANGPISLNSIGQMDMGSVTSAGYVLANAGTDMSFDNVSAGGYISLTAAGAITTGDLDGGDTLLLAHGNVSTGALDALGRVLIADASMSSIGRLANGFDPNLVFGATPIVPTAGSITLNGTARGTQFFASTEAAFSSGDIQVFVSSSSLVASPGNGILFVNAGGALTAGNLLAPRVVHLLANGAIGTGTLRSDGDGVKVASFGGNVAVGGITSRNDALIYTPASLTVSGGTNARDVLLLAGTNVSTGAITALGASQSLAFGPASGVTGRVLIANNTLSSESFLRSTSLDYATLFAATPVRVGGSINLGPLVAGQLVAYSQGAMTGAAITATNLLDVESGGLVTISQRWVSLFASIDSGDIRIIDNGSLTDAAGRPILSGLHSSSTGSIRLVSISSGQTLIGDGLSGTGYALSAAELALISTSELSIGASNSTASAAGMRIGNLALTAGGSIGQSTLAGPNGRVLFATGNRDTGAVGGSIRIVGNVTGTGFAGSNVVEFATGRFELDAATGSLALTQTGTALGGTVEIRAANIHFASGAILDRLAVDPFYAGHENDLNRAAAVSRPEGVLRSLGLDLFPTGTLYIQNTGTFLDPAGFFADFEFSDLTPPANARPGSIAVIVNGKWQTEAGIVSGTAARDLVVDNNADTLGFYTASSSVNGCALNAAVCAASQELDPTPAITGQIAIVSNNVLGNSPQFTPEPSSSVSGEGAQTTEEAQEEAEAAAAAATSGESSTSPIAPPPQIINSAPLEQKQSIDQPVAGSGNPSLIGSVVNENSAEGTAQ